MKKLTFHKIDGYFSKDRCELIKEKLTGKTYLNFQFQYGGVADNKVLSVYTDQETTKEELESMFIYVLINEL